LTRDGLDALVVRQESDADFGQRGRGLAVFALTAIVRAGHALPAAVAEFSTGARRALRAITLTSAFASSSAFTARARAVTTAAFGLYTLVAGKSLKPIGFGFSLCPCRLKQVLKVETKIY
jgi:hypothetical protein